jgi:metallo-beta-lactamase family protein
MSQEEDARCDARNAARRGSIGQSIAPLYSVLDALNSFDHFGRTAVSNEPVEIAPGVRATFINAGHILGSACIYLQLTEGSQQSTARFSGDLASLVAH